ncbi:retrovirus-related pol polyprotein from transposon TNT 1-94 [Tanacetum coccineum]
MPKALISDRGTHFCNQIMKKTMKRYGVNHRFCHPQTSGQVENTNRALNRILEKTVKDNPAIWSRKLNDALWAFCIAYKTPTGTTPYKLIYGKNCHLPFEIEHRAYWALKNYMNTSVNVNSFVAMNDSMNYVKKCNKCLELEAELIKQHNMVEKIRKGFCHNNIKNGLRKLKGKDIVDNAAQASNTTTIAPIMYKLDLVNLAPKDKNNKEAHIYHLKHIMEQAAILREIVEQAKSLNPLDSASYSACKYVKLIQELIGYVRDTCPDIHKPSEKLVAITPINKKKAVRFSKHMTGDRSQLTNFVHKFLGTVKFNNDQIAKIMGVNRKKYILIIVDDYSQFTWVKFLASKDEVPDFIIKFLKMIQVRLNAPVKNIQTDNGTEFVNQTLCSYYESVDISHETSVAQSPQQNGVVKRQNRTLVEAARTMLIYIKAPLFLWAEAVATACYT